jgi:hypothetical protein
MEGKVLNAGVLLYFVVTRPRMMPHILGNRCRQDFGGNPEGNAPL